MSRGLISWEGFSGSQLLLWSNRGLPKRTLIRHVVVGIYASKCLAGLHRRRFAEIGTSQAGPAAPIAEHGVDAAGKDDADSRCAVPPPSCYSSRSG